MSIKELLRHEFLVQILLEKKQHILEQVKQSENSYIGTF